MHGAHLINLLLSGKRSSLENKNTDHKIGSVFLFCNKAAHGDEFAML
jgi:hypothetical protein